MMAFDIFIIICFVCLFLLATVCLVKGIQLIKKSYKNQKPPINRTGENCAEDGVMYIFFAIVMFFLLLWGISLEGCSLKGIHKTGKNFFFPFIPY